LPEQPILAQRLLLAERLASQVDVACVVAKSECPARAISAAGDIPAAAAFVIDVCRPSWNGRT
jgi:hypothetical protein